MIKHHFSLLKAFKTLRTLHLHNQKKKKKAKKNKVLFCPKWLVYTGSKYKGSFPCVTLGGSISSLFGKMTYWIESKKESDPKPPIWLRNLNNLTCPFFISGRILIHSSKRKLQQTKPHFSTTSQKTLGVYPSQLNLIHFTYSSKKIMHLIKP